MSAQKTPMQLVHEEHGGKEKLVDKILGNLEPEGEEDKADLKRRLLSASNKKLLRLAKSAQVLKEKYGSREKLVEQVAAALGRVKDADFVKRLDGYTHGRLLDMARGLVARGATSQAAAAKAAGAARPRAQAPAKPKAEKPAAKKAASKPGTKAKAAKGAKAPAKKAAPKKGKKK